MTGTMRLAAVLATGLAFWIASMAGGGVSPAGRGAPELTLREIRGQAELVGKDDQLRYWVDRFGRVHSPEMTVAADAYNQWVTSRYRGWFGIEPPKGHVEMLSHVPPGPRGIDPVTGVFRIPHRIHSDGALTRDLLSIPFFQQGVRLVSQWERLLADCRRIQGEARCARFAPDLAGARQDSAGEVDDRWLELRLRELRKARALLEGMQRVLEGMPMAVPGGQVFTYADDVARYPARLEECWSILRAVPRIDILSGSMFCSLHPEFAAHPPEWMTEYVEGEAITPQIARVLLSFERQISSYLDVETFEASLTTQAGR